VALCLVSAFGFGCMAIFAKDAYKQDLGITSLGALTMRDRLARATGLSLPPSAVYDLPTPSALAEYLGAELDGTSQRSTS
jgi:hypothetical protein